MEKDIKNLVINDSWYTLRRYFVDLFFLGNIESFESNSNIIDLGGKKSNKRGAFDVEEYNLNIKYANLDESTAPDFLCEISNVPVEASTFDGAIMAEVLEHIETPETVLKETFRLLKPEGHLMLTVPFMFPVHADPYDFHRYTALRLENLLTAAGFKVISINRQGGFAAVFANMIKIWNYQMDSNGMFKRNILKKCAKKIVSFIVKRSFQWDDKDFCKNNRMLSGFTLGYEVIARKQKV